MKIEMPDKEETAGDSFNAGMKSGLKGTKPKSTLPDLVDQSQDSAQGYGNNAMNRKFQKLNEV